MSYIHSTCTRMESKEGITWRKCSATIYETITASDAARNSLLNKLYAAGLVAENVKVQIQGQAAMTGANTLINELSTTIRVREVKFYEIVSVMVDVEQLKDIAEVMIKQCPNPKAEAIDGDALGMCVYTTCSSIYLSLIQCTLL